jgi:hypothetical protein
MLNAHRGGDVPEVNNIPPSLSYRPADPLSNALIGRRAKCSHFYGFRNAVVRKTLSDR